MRLNTLGEFIKTRREKLGMTQRELAGRTGLRSAPYICDVEKGSRQLGERFMPKMAEALGVPLDELKNHDPRAPFSEAEGLFQKDPEYIRVMNRIICKAKSGKLPASEILWRISNPKTETIPDP